MQHTPPHFTFQNYTTSHQMASYLRGNARNSHWWNSLYRMEPGIPHSQGSCCGATCHSYPCLHTHFYGRLFNRVLRRHNRLDNIQTSTVTSVIQGNDQSQLILCRQNGVPWWIRLIRRIMAMALQVLGAIAVFYAICGIVCFTARLILLGLRWYY